MVVNEYKIKRSQYGIFIGYALLVVGLFTSTFFRAMPSLGLGILLFTSLFDLDRPFHSLKSNITSYILLPFFILYDIIIHLPYKFHQLYKHKSLFLFSLIYLLHLLSCFLFEIENIDDIQREVSLKSIILLLPLIIANSPKLTHKQLLGLFYLFLISLFCAIVWSLYYYTTHFQVVNEAISRSKPFPVPTNHVRFSLITTLGACTAIYFRLKNLTLGYFPKLERIVLTIFSFLFPLFLHISMVRSGLLCFYLSVFLGFLYYIRIKKNRTNAWRLLISKFGIGILLVMFSIPVLSYLYIPTVKNKIDNTILDMSKKGDESGANYYSLTARFFSYDVGIHVWKENFWVGTGIANLKKEIYKAYIRKHPGIKDRKLPHNQFIRYAAAFGTIGSILFCIFFYSVILKKGLFIPALLYLHLFIISVSFMFEGTLETQLGLNFTLIFIFIHYLASSTLHFVVDKEN